MCSTGSTAQAACAAGTVQPDVAQGSCEPCAAGSFQPLPGSTDCEPCTAGFFCAEGAAAALPCPGGTHKNSSLDVMMSEAQCVTCPEGTYCPVGSDVAKPCAPGTFNAAAGANVPLYYCYSYIIPPSSVRCSF